MAWDDYLEGEALADVGDDPTPPPRDVEFMALVLEGRHGIHAAEVAAFFSDYHSGLGDAGRSWAWAGVAEIVRRRQHMRASDAITCS